MLSTNTNNGVDLFINSKIRIGISRIATTICQQYPKIPSHFKKLFVLSENIF